MGDKRDVRIGTTFDAKTLCNGLLELDKSVHVCPSGSKHVVAPEDHSHAQFPVPEHALHELEAGAVVEFLIDDGVPRNGDGPAANR